MNIELVQIRPGDTLDKRNASMRKINEVSTVAIIMGKEISAKVLDELSCSVLHRGVELISIYGEQSEELHDLVDQRALTLRRAGELVTTWDKDRSIADFVRTVSFVYRGVLDTCDQDRGTLVCYVSDEEVIPKELERAVESIRGTTLPVRNGSSAH